MTDPAFVQGNKTQGIVFFIEDKGGNLVDLEYACSWCWEYKLDNDRPDWLPAYDWPEYTVVCKYCGDVVNEGKGDEE